MAACKKNTPKATVNVFGFQTNIFQRENNLCVSQKHAVNKNYFRCFLTFLKRWGKPIVLSFPCCVLSASSWAAGRSELCVGWREPCPRCHTGSCQASLPPGSRAKSCPPSAAPRPWAGPASHRGTCAGPGTRARLDFLPLTAPAQLVVRGGKFTASNYPGPLVMTLCPLQFPWDTVPLLPSSPELRGARLASQNRFFFSAQRKSGLRLC